MFGDAERNSGLPLNYVPQTRRCGPTLGTLVIDSLRLEADPSLLLLSLDAVNRKHRSLLTHLRRQALALGVPEASAWL